ncbi:MAG TPA: type II secretion system F family protein [Candidatus Krumholzibacteriaceae bacterium]|nr:type II secretion system F family protein [Candidatus Krumholzibacteriaceae bacterium]
MPLIDMLEGWSFRLFGSIAPAFLRNVFEFREHLKRADIKIYPETYVSLMFFTALLTFPVSIAAIVLLYFTQIIPLVFLVPMPAYVMIGFIVMPLSKASERATVLEREVPFAATYITVMATGGIPPYVSFKRLSNVELLPATRKEAKDIIKDVEIFGIDPLTAMDQAAKKNPLEIFKDFLSGYASTVIIGGDINHFLETKAGDIFKARAARVKNAAERLGMLLESFITIMVLMSLCFYILFSVQSIYSTGGGMDSTMLMYTYVFTPMLCFVFIYLAHNMQPKSPITDYLPYKVFGISAVFAIVIFLLLTNFMGIIYVPALSGIQSIVDLPIAVSVTLFIATAPAAVVYGRVSAKKSSLERGVANFLRDLTETRKTGLAPEKCIESLSARDYGEFSHELRKISSEISWGIPVRKVILDFVKRTKSWITQIVMFLLVETIDVGGGTIGMIESLARFNSMTQEVEKEKKMEVRPFVFLPYFAAILLVSTTVMMLIFTTKTVNIGGQTKAIDMSFLQTIFATSAIVHSYLIGLVAGKISEESVAAGFKHSAILVVIAILAAKLVPQFISF